MKNICIKASALALLFAGASFFASCGKKTDEPKPTPPEKKEEVKPTPTPADGDLPEITKVTFRIGESHLHSKKGIHYLGNNAQLTFPLLAQEQLITFVKEGDTWKLAAGAPDKFLATEMIQYFPKDPTSAAPDYALWVKYYDAKGNEVNAAYADAKVRNQYQLFVFPTDVKAFDDGDDEIEFEPTNPRNVFHYEYCDTDPWNKSFQWSAKHDPVEKQVKWLSDNEPLGMKGYMQFKKMSQLTLHFALWHAPKGKLADGKPSPFYAPNKQFTDGGKKIFEVTLPVYVCNTRDFSDLLKQGYQGGPVPYDQFFGDNTRMADRLKKVLKTEDWMKIAQDFINIYKGAGDEKGGEEF